MPLSWVLFDSALVSPGIHSALASRLRRSARTTTPAGFTQLSLRASGPRLELRAPSQLERLGRYRVHLYFYHTAGAPAPLEKRPQDGTDEPGQLNGALDDEAPARGRRRAGRPQRRGWINDESPDARESDRGLIEESPRRRGRLATGGDMTEALVRGIAELGAE